MYTVENRIIARAAMGIRTRYSLSLRSGNQNENNESI